MLLIPLSVVISVVHGVILGGFGLAGVDTTGESAGWLVLLLVAVGTMLTLLGFAVVQAATVCALVEVDEGRDVGAMRAYRLALRRFRPLLVGLAAGVAIWAVLSATGLLVPVAIWLAVSWLLLAQVVELEDRSALQSLRRSSALVWGRWLRVAFIVGIGALLALAAGPLLGALLIFLTEAPLVAPEHRRGRRVRARDAVRRPHDGVCLLRRQSPRGARARRRSEGAAGRDRASTGYGQLTTRSL